MTLSLATFIGNRPVTQELAIELEACKRRGVVPGHTLIMGFSGAGKTRLAATMAAETGLEFLNCDAALIDDVMQDVIFNLLGQSSGDHSLYTFNPYLVFLDEAHGLNRKSQNLLLKIMYDKKFEFGGVTYDCRNLCFTMATTNVEELIGPLKQRCELKLELRRYTNEELAQILAVCGIEVEDGGCVYVIKPGWEVAYFVAQRSRYTPRIAKQYLTRIYNRARAQAETPEQATALMTVEMAQEFFEMKRVSDNGLTPRDIDYLKALNASKKPMGVASIAANLDVEAEEIRKDIEPFLRFQQYISFTKQGRELTPAGRDVVRDYEQAALTREQLSRMLG